MKDVDVPQWLKGLPMAPEFHPTDTEFADPIAYISKIEKEASAFGICKIIPPLPKPSKKYVLYNLNKSLSKCPELVSDPNIITKSKMDNAGKGNSDGGERRAVFTTRHQELGSEKGKRVKGVGGQISGAQKQVWQSGEVYTLEQFEAKSKNFARSQLGMVKEVSPLIVEAMFWKASSAEKPIYVEYANDVPGSGFSEPVGSLRLFHKYRRRRRKRKSFDRNNLENPDNKYDQLDLLNTSSQDKDAGCQKDPGLCNETTMSSSSSMQSHQVATVSGHTDSNCTNEMEGTAGWKLSNSPWNLQVIARSAGSLTRFMPDDIPGVTSPMVYVGMLFSWFAWHVEDHELHSLNFLHIGAPKTWYAVPGDYAFNFEEVIRLNAYGGNTDRLAALSLLGEKTTVLSPEVIVASSIPCCRLVQYPGEFVVTFPRAYHIGFSHGFNCGEAANFGTPEWLAVAKEAAVRRAAMNYLPMLSHQQLLYLLTMSFISRIPRSLLPGVRSSRRRDRQKEERELLVKKAFILDIVNENNLLTILLKTNSSYRAVLWDLDILPSSIKEPEFCNGTDAAISTSGEKADPDNEDNQDHSSLLEKCINAVDFDLDDDDLAYDFHIESGTLPCLACGILGFPFMAVVQPSEEASKTLMHEGVDTAQDLEVPKQLEPHFLSGANLMEGSIPGKARSNIRDLTCPGKSVLAVGSSQPTDPSIEQSPISNRSLSPKNKGASSKVTNPEGWNTNNGFVKPQIFCLEHAIEIEQVLRPKGGANVLVICHSDFQKIKVHAAAVAEEILVPFTYNEIQLDTALQEDMCLIDFAIDREEQTKCAEDWTSQMGINLQHCVKLKRNFPSKKILHLLRLGALFSNATPNLNSSSFFWKSRKLRSKRHLNHSSKRKSLDDTKITEEHISSKLEHPMARKEVKFIQYSRRKYKSHISPVVSGALKDCTDCFPGNVKEADNVDQEKEEAKSTNGSVLVGVEDIGLSSPGVSAIASGGQSERQHEPSKVSPTRVCNENSLPSQRTDPPIPAMSESENVEACAVICSSNEMIVKENSCISTGHDSEFGRCHYGVFSDAPIVPVQSNTGNEIARDEQTTKEVESQESDIFLSFEGKQDIQTDGKDEFKAVSKGEQDIQTDRNDSDKAVSEGQQAIQTEGDKQDKAVSIGTAMIKAFTSGSVESLYVPTNEHAVMESCDHDGGDASLADHRESNYSTSTIVQSEPIVESGRKRKREVDLLTQDQLHVGGFIIGPCESLRPRVRKDASGGGTDCKKPAEEKLTVKKLRKDSSNSFPHKNKKEQEKIPHESERSKDKKEHKKRPYKCEIEGCRMSFKTKAEILLHNRNQCPVEGCRKKFNSHKYAVQHQRVHDDDRPLKCPWKGCTMSFKWAWARTEHIRVHTGERPYVCKVKGCGLTFRFVSDFSRHRRKTSHQVKVS